MLDPLVRPLFIPFVAGLLCLLLPRHWGRQRAWIAIVGSALTVYTVCPGLIGGNQEAAFGKLLLLRVDALSRFVLLAVGVFTLLISVYSLSYMQGRDGQRTYYVCLLWTLSFSCGVLLANELLLLLVCWGLLAVTLYLMIGLAGPVASSAAQKTLVIVGGSDALLLLGAALLWTTHGTTRMDVDAVSTNSVSNILAFFCFLSAALAKAGAVPLHSWLPDCGEHADAPVTAYLPAALDKLLGIYLLARIVTDLFSITRGFSAFMMTLGALTVIGAVLMALVQHNLKRLLAYHAVSQVGYMIMGVSTGTPLGLAGGLFHMLNHAVYKSCLFLTAGAVEKKTGTVDLDQLGGLATRLPVTFVTCLIASLSIAGIPPLNGFASKWMIYQSVIESHIDDHSMLWVSWVAIAMLGSVLTLASFVKVLHGVFLCKPSPRIRELKLSRVDWAMALPMLLLAGLCVIFGVFADAIPLGLLVRPAVGQPVAFAGVWWARQVAGFFLIAFVLGWTVYWLTMRDGKLRKVPTYIGGERLDETRIPGVPMGPGRHVEVTGVDFYRTVEQLPLLRKLYKVSRTQVLDIYETGGSIAAGLSAFLRGAHTGDLPFYVTWFVLGLIGILSVMMEGVP